MPFVKARHIPLAPCNDGRGMAMLANALPQIVAEALSCSDPDGGLIPQEVEVSVEEYGRFDITGGYDLQVIIDANYFPSRQANLPERIEQIRDRLAEAIVGPPIKFYVWVRLMPAAFAEGWSIGL